MKNIVMMTSLMVAIAAGATVAAGKEHGHGGPGRHISFDNVDTNKDGKLTQAEMEAHMEARFNETDADNNGLVSPEELSARMAEKQSKRIDKRVRHMMDRKDANEDGQLSKEEMKPRFMAKMLKRADTDGDGALSKAEFEAVKAKHAKRHKDKHKGDDQNQE